MLSNFLLKLFQTLFFYTFIASASFPPFSHLPAWNIQNSEKKRLKWVNSVNTANSLRSEPWNFDSEIVGLLLIALEERNGNYQRENEREEKWKRRIRRSRGETRRGGEKVGRLIDVDRAPSGLFFLKVLPADTPGRKDSWSLSEPYLVISFLDNVPRDVLAILFLSVLSLLSRVYFQSDRIGCFDRPLAPSCSVDFYWLKRSPMGAEQTF